MIPNLNVATNPGYPPSSYVHVAGAETSELVGVVKDFADKLFAVFTAGSGQRIVPVKPGDLQSFTAFKRRVADEISLWIRHRSEDERTARQQSREWADEVERAFQRGAAEAKR